ncbi:hypothetical protein ACQRBP_04350 [Eubacteriales bacterium SGI.150]
MNEETKTTEATVYLDGKPLGPITASFEVVAEGFRKWILSVASAVEARHEMETAMRWASVSNRPMLYRYRHTKKKKTRKKYEKKILAWYREEVLGKW